MILVAAAITLLGYGTLVTSTYPPLRSIGLVSIVAVVTLASHPWSSCRRCSPVRLRSRRLCSGPHEHRHDTGPPPGRSGERNGAGSPPLDAPRVEQRHDLRRHFHGVRLLPRAGVVRDRPRRHLDRLAGDGRTRGARSPRTSPACFPANRAAALERRALDDAAKLRARHHRFPSRAVAAAASSRRRCSRPRTSPASCSSRCSRRAAASSSSPGTTATGRSAAC